MPPSTPTTLHWDIVDGRFSYYFPHDELWSSTIKGDSRILTVVTPPISPTGWHVPPWYVHKKDNFFVPYLVVTETKEVPSTIERLLEEVQRQYEDIAITLFTHDPELQALASSKRALCVLHSVLQGDTTMGDSIHGTGRLHFPQGHRAVADNKRYPNIYHMYDGDRKVEGCEIIDGTGRGVTKMEKKLVEMQAQLDNCPAAFKAAAEAEITKLEQAIANLKGNDGIMGRLFTYEVEAGEEDGEKRTTVRLSAPTGSVVSPLGLVEANGYNRPGGLFPITRPADTMASLTPRFNWNDKNDKVVGAIAGYGKFSVCTLDNDEEHCIVTSYEMVRDEQKGEDVLNQTSVSVVSTEMSHKRLDSWPAIKPVGKVTCGNNGKTSAGDDEANTPLADLGKKMAEKNGKSKKAKPDAEATDEAKSEDELAEATV